MMNEENKKRNIVAALMSLLFFCLIFAGVSISYAEKKNKSDVNVEIVQLYSSDYNLECFDNKYFIGSYEKNKIDVIIDETGSEILRNIDNIYYDGIYKMKDERYLIYNNRNNSLTTYIFDGDNIELFYEIKDVSYAKPIVFKGIDREYILGFASMKDNNLYLYGLDSSGIVVINDTKIVADEYSGGIYYTYNEAASQFGDNLPTLAHFEELKTFCTWTWTNKGYLVKGSNGNSIILYATGSRTCEGKVNSVGKGAGYWTSTVINSEEANAIIFYENVGVFLLGQYRCVGSAVRLIK